MVDIHVPNLVCHPLPRNTAEQDLAWDLIPALNAHTIPGKDIPNQPIANNLWTIRTIDLLPQADVLAAKYIHHGGHLTY